MGAVLTPLLAGEHPEAAELAGASTLCGACMDSCPVQIPLQDLLLSLRRRRAADAPTNERRLWQAWAAAWSSPLGYRASTRAAGWSRLLSSLTERAPGFHPWGEGRTVPRPAARRFRDSWKRGVT
jgi:L-lactate dehydrogenase complex protein LldF